MPKAQTYAQLRRQIDELQREADKLRQTEIKGVVDRIKEAIAVYGLTAADLGLEAGNPPPASAPARQASRGAAQREAKYQDAHGNVWGGRGPRPRWLRDALAAGHPLEDFARVKSQT